MSPKKTTTKKEDVKGKKFRVASKAGLLTYNEVLIKTEADLQKHDEELRKKYPDAYFSSCLEKESRLHVHTFFESEERIDCDLEYFKTSKSGKVGDFKANRGKNVDRGHYYCQCPYKTSHIFQVNNKLIKPAQKWLMDMWREDKIEKITQALAAEKLLTPQLTLQITAVENHKKKMRVQKALGERAERLKAQLKPFAPIPLVEEWKESFLKEELRYKFLALVGPSKMRKTEYAKSLFKNPYIHKDKLDWSEYDWEKNDCVIFDDINEPCHIWKFVRLNKVLFQSSSMVSVQTSNTNMYKLDICVVQTPMIICTNDKDLVEHESHVEWIKSNSVWVSVVKPIPFLGSSAA